MSSSGALGFLIVERAFLALGTVLPLFHLASFLPAALQVAGHWLCLSVPPEVQTGRKRPRAARGIVVATLVCDTIGLTLLAWEWADRINLLSKPDWLPDPGFALLIPLVFLQFPIVLARYIERPDLSWWGQAIRWSFLVLAVLLLASIFGAVGLAIGGGGGAAVAGILLATCIAATVISILDGAYCVLLFRLAPATGAYAARLGGARSSAKAEPWPGTKPLGVSLACSIGAMLLLGLVSLRGGRPRDAATAAVAGLYVHLDKPNQRMLLAENGEFSYTDKPGVLEQIVTRASGKGIQFGVNTAVLDDLVSGSYSVEGNDIVVRYNDPNAKFAAPKLTLDGDKLTAPGFGTFVKRPDLLEKLEKARDEFMKPTEGGARGVVSKEGLPRKQHAEIALARITARSKPPDHPTPKPEESTPQTTDGFASTRAGETRDADGLKLAWIPAGDFTMGSPKDEKDRSDDENQVQVTLSKGFWLGQHEVTQGEWQRVMQTTPWRGKEFVKEGDDYPATYVSWDDAMRFCEKLTETERQAGRLPADWQYNLPSEAQWEHACRAGTRSRFSFGDDDSDLGDHAWFWQNGSNTGEKYAHQVAQKKANPWGLFDMHGNVWEWCRDRSERELSGRTRSYRAQRGGCWDDAAGRCRSAARSQGTPDYRSYYQGFRVAAVPSGK